MAHRMLQVGESAPWFVCRSAVNTQLRIDGYAGKYVVLCFFGTASDSDSQHVLNDVIANRQAFDGLRACFFGVSVDSEDESQGRVKDDLPGVRFLWDFDRAVSRQFGAVLEQSAGGESYQRFSIVLDRRLRVVSTVPLGEPKSHVRQLNELLESLFNEASDSPAPVLVVPGVFTPQFCDSLIEYYLAHGGEESGVMMEEQGMTVYKFEFGYKRRCDRRIVDESLRTTAMHRIHHCLAPEILKAFQFRATRIERYIVACYDSATGGHFNPHRDNTTKGTVHRRFAVSINLNSDFEGGDLRFPEFGNTTYRPSIGGAVVFSCSLMHEAMPITSGKRYAFLPFLYDDAGAETRKANMQYVKRDTGPNN